MKYNKLVTDGVKISSKVKMKWRGVFGMRQSTVRTYAHFLFKILLVYILNSNLNTLILHRTTAVNCKAFTHNYRFMTIESS